VSAPPISTDFSPFHIPLSAYSLLILVSAISSATIGPSVSNESNASSTPSTSGEQIRSKIHDAAIHGFQATGAHGMTQYVACMMSYRKKKSSRHVSCTSRHLLPQLTNLFCRFEGPQAAERPLLWNCFMLVSSKNHHWLL
jgi:hypothetical protein